MVLQLTVTCFSWYCNWLTCFSWYCYWLSLFIVLLLTITCFSWYCDWLALAFHGTAIDCHLLFMVPRLPVTCFSALDKHAESLCRPWISDGVPHFKSPLLRSTGCQNTVVGTVTGLRSGRPRNLVRLPMGARDFSPKCPHLLWGPPCLLFRGYSGYFLCGVKRPGRVTDHLHVVPRLRGGGPLTYTRAYVFMTCTGTPLPLFYKAFQIASFRVVA